jgi:hypothetical protein
MNRTRRPMTTPPIDPDMTPAVLLRGAATYLGLYGWAQGEFFANSSPDNPFPAACSLGAINACAHGRPVLSSDETAEDDLTNAAITAARVLAAHLDDDYASGDHATSAIDIVSGWNDQDNTTLATIIENLHEAADDWDKAHPAGGDR